MPKNDVSIAVLARTNQQLRIYQDLLYAAGIRYHILGGVSFYALKEIRKILDCVRETYRFHSGPRAVELAIQQTGILDYCKNYAEIDSSPYENIREIQRVAERFKTGEELLRHAQKVQAASRMKKGVSLATIHASKGREFQVVFVVGVQEGLLPHKSSENLDEEARLLFVAVSRAEKELYLSHWGPISRFMNSVKTIPTVHKTAEPQTTLFANL
jgi:DNA helicase-2/ATP-dependent DNA helicase PcrA